MKKRPVGNHRTFFMNLEIIADKLRKAADRRKQKTPDKQYKNNSFLNFAKVFRLGR